MNSFEKNDHFK